MPRLGLCLSLLAQAVKDNVVPYVLPFVEQNIRSDNWHAREAATLAFGSILDGPSKGTLARLVSVAFDGLLSITALSMPINLIFSGQSFLGT